MVQIHRDIVNQNQSNVPGRKMTPKYITVHNTANSSRGANARIHARYLNNGSGGRQASWHYTVDDKEIWQTLEDNQQGWHAGDGGGSGNTSSIGIEICENSDGNFKKAVANAQWLIRQLMDKHNIPIENVVTHQRWSGKNCPRLLLNQWGAFIHGIQANDDVVHVSRPKPQKLPQPVAGSIVDYLKSIGEDSSFTNRAKLADKYGIDNYQGTASQNLDLLNKLTHHYIPAKERTPEESKKTSSYKGNSIVDYLNSLDLDSSFNARKKLADQYGIKNYKGTASQNKQLLDKLRKNEGKSSSKSSSYKGTSLVDYLKSIGEDSSFDNRRRLASKYGIKGYKGTAEQNTKLLNKLR